MIPFFTNFAWVCGDSLVMGNKICMFRAWVFNGSKICFAFSKIIPFL